ncbi:pentapeptide repeat-containing protein [Streptomyces filipinensis]|uniref:pentapeptide repeat-containing protein n=1 Tax=Streptomyces filipinensis TaxID=66887 RepID=UPI0017833367|nr:pentapeptide repeat-containing protein [Streptomyces filipinensis]
MLALEQVVQDAPEQATHAAQVLGHFVRDRAPPRPGYAPDGEPTPTDTSLPTIPEADVQVALTSLTRPKSRAHVDQSEMLSFATLYLAGARLFGADLTRADLSWANLTDVPGLTPEQVRSARINAETVLPPNIRTAVGLSTT